MGYLPPGALSESQFLHQVLGKGCRRWRTCPISLPTNSSPPPSLPPPQAAGGTGCTSRALLPALLTHWDHTPNWLFFWFWKSLSQMACQINVHTRLQK